MAKKTLPPTTADARNRAVLAITEAVCGYLRMEGQHVCQRPRLGQGDGCTMTTWAGMVRAVEDVLAGWEPVA